MIIPRVDALVVTALGLERAAVRAHLDDVATVDLGAVVADIGVLEEDNRRATVAVIETGPGNVNAAVLVAAAEHALQPDIAVMVGIAGGVKDVEIGDVVASSKIYAIESGKQQRGMHARPDMAPVSPRLLQLARAVAADGTWTASARVPATRHATGTPAQALIAPIAALEKVVGESSGPLAALLRRSYGDAVALAMEDFGASRAATAREHAVAISIRGISDLLADKEQADKSGTQPLAASNAAAFAAEVILRATRSQTASARDPDGARMTALASTAASLYPRGPLERSVWTRAGGDPAQLDLDGPAAAQWWAALDAIRRGGGGHGITVETLVRTMREDYPNNDALAVIARHDAP